MKKNTVKEAIDWMNVTAKKMAKDHVKNRSVEITTEYQVEQLILCGMNLAYLKFRNGGGLLDNTITEDIF